MENVIIAVIVIAVVLIAFGFAAMYMTTTDTTGSEYNEPPSGEPQPFDPLGTGQTSNPAAGSPPPFPG
jgi:hypothetical protein